LRIFSIGVCCVALCAHLVGGYTTFVCRRRQRSSWGEGEIRRSSLRQSEVFWIWSWLVLTCWKSVRSRTLSSRSFGPLSLQLSSWRFLEYFFLLDSLVHSRGRRTRPVRALHNLLRPGSPSIGHSRGFCPRSSSSPSFWEWRGLESLNTALCVFWLILQYHCRRHLGRDGPSLQVLRTTWTSELHRLWSKSHLAWSHYRRLGFNKLSFLASCALLRSKEGSVPLLKDLCKNKVWPADLPAKLSAARTLPCQANLNVCDLNW